MLLQAALALTDLVVLLPDSKQCHNQYVDTLSADFT